MGDKGSSSFLFEVCCAVYAAMPRGGGTLWVQPISIALYASLASYYLPPYMP